MANIDDYIDSVKESIKPKAIDKNISKMIVDSKDLAQETLPTAMALGDLKEIGYERIRSSQIPQMLLSHPAVERGIEFKFNRMIKQLDKHAIDNNIIPFNDKKLAKQAKDYIVDIMKNSAIQPVTWLKQFGRDAMRFGDNYFVLIPNRAKQTILRWELQNPIFFSPMYDLSDKQSNVVNHIIDVNNKLVKYRIDPKTKKPKEYTQLKKLNQPVGTVGLGVSCPGNMQFVPTGKTFNSNRVVQLNFDRIGDEPLGIPIIQTIWQTVNQIIRVEDAGAETMVAFGYNKWISHTPFKTKERMEEYAKSIENIRKRSVLVLPDGVKLDNITPGSTEFDKVEDILLSTIAMRLGISIIQLKGQGADINKSTLSTMMRDIRHDFFADELELEAAINDGIIKSCNFYWNLKTTKDFKNFPYPSFSFSPLEEDKDELANRRLKTSLTTWNITKSVEKLYNLGLKEEGDKILEQHLSLITPGKITQEKLSEEGDTIDT